jgi:hypothetical protein
VHVGATMVGRSQGERFVQYRLLADVVVVTHLSFIAFVAAGGLLAWKWPGLLWVHIPVVVWAVAIVTVGFTCPLTPLEKYLRDRAGESSYDGGFVDHYLDGVVYPGRFTAVARMLVALLIAVGYGRLLARRRDRLPDPLDSAEHSGDRAPARVADSDTAGVGGGGV